MNNNTNTILEAIGELDNEVLEKAFKKKKKKPIALIAVAGAAALSLLIGAAHLQEWNTAVFVAGEWQFYITTRPHTEGVILPIEELTEMGVTDIKFDPPRNYMFGDDSKNYEYYINEKPSEIIKKYNLKPLINDNFSEDIMIDDVPEVIEPYMLTFFPYDDDTDNLIPGTGVIVSSDDAHDSVVFSYYMIDKQSGIPVYVRAGYDILRRFNEDLGGFVSFSSKYDHKIIDLNNGEKAIAGHWGEERTMIAFAYDNTSFMMVIKGSVDDAAQILKNLGIVAE